MVIRDKNGSKYEKAVVRKLSEGICGQLKGKRIFLYGQDAGIREQMVNGLKYVNEQNRLEMDIRTAKTEGVSSEQNILKKDDLVIMLGEMTGTGSECLKQLEQSMTELEVIRKAEPAAVVYVSDSRVYGKSFGPQKSCRENELGYVCHTAMDEADRQCMRMAEHLVCRMAKEQQMPVKVVRLDPMPGAGVLYGMLPYILSVLLKGLPGEIYNVTIPEGQQDQNNENAADTEPLAWKENRSPLTAMEIRMNTEKVRNYVASELFE